MIDVIAIPGADELIGKGVYLGLPNAIPEPVRDRTAIVVGEAVKCAAAARQLRGAGWSVTVVRVGTEVVCAAGGEYLEAIVLRRIDSGRINACNASALFIL